MLVIGLSMTKEAVGDYARHKQDHQQNISLTERFNGTSMSQCEWRQVVSGDIVRVVRDQSFPCDIVLLASSLEDSVCFAETKNLDGETNLKIKRGVEGTGDGRPGRMAQDDRGWRLRRVRAPKQLIVYLHGEHRRAALGGGRRGWE